MLGRASGIQPDPILLLELGVVEVSILGMGVQFVNFFAGDGSNLGFCDMCYSR